MPSAREFINSFTSDLENIQDRYKRFYINPYTRAYLGARTKFQETLKAQAEANKARLELALSAFSLVGGHLLSRVLANATLKAKAAEVTVNVICRLELERAFKLAHFAESNKTASFVLGQLWDKGQSLLSDKLKSR